MLQWISSCFRRKVKEYRGPCVNCKELEPWNAEIEQIKKYPVYGPVLGLGTVPSLERS